MPGEPAPGAELLIRLSDKSSTMSHASRGNFWCQSDLRLSDYFGTSPGFWLNLQKSSEFRVVEIESENEIAKQVNPRDMAGAAWGLGL